MTDSLFVDVQDLDLAPSTIEYFTIMIVDDDEFVHAATKFVLDRIELFNRHIKFIDAYSGAGGANLIQYHNVDLILLDAVMASETDGIEFACYVKNNIGDIPIIMRTGFAGLELDALKDKHMCIDEFICKTDTTHDFLISKVSAWLARKIST